MRRILFMLALVGIALTDTENLVAAATGDCASVTYTTAALPTARDGTVIVVASRVEAMASERAADRAIDQTLDRFLADFGVDHSEDDEAIALDAKVGVKIADFNGEVALEGVGLYRAGKLMHTTYAVKVGGTGLPFNLSDDIFGLMEKAQEKKSQTPTKLVLTMRDLGSGWSKSSQQVLDC